MLKKDVKKEGGKTRDDSTIRALLGRRSSTRVRLVLQGRKPQQGLVSGTSYSQLPGYATVVEVRTLREFRRLWRAVEATIEGGAWRAVRRAPGPSELPAAGAPLADDRTA